MNRKSIFNLLCVCSILFLFSCQKDIDVQTPPIDLTPSFELPAPSPLRGNITGVVVNENNVVVENAEVSFGAIVTMTDNRGFFSFSNVTMDKYITTVKINKAGYFQSIRTFSATASRNYLSIKLIPKTLTGTIDAASGGTVSLSNGTVIDLPASGMIVKTTGAAYTGTVNVYASYIDPTAEDFGARIPGSMMGQKDYNLYVLQSTGMIAVDLESPTGVPLQLSTGSSANVKLPIPSSLTGKAPTTIDTWSLDDRGVWVKEGTAIRNGNYYDMPVSHFSFWNCDVPANAVYLTLLVQNQNNQPLANTFVTLTIPNNNSWWASTYGQTDSAGVVAGLVPANLALQMSVSTNLFTCNSSLFSQTIGPFSSNSNLTVTVTLNTQQSLTISGILNDCNGQPVQNGTASIQVGTYNYITTPVINGNYSITTGFCSNISNSTIWLVDDSTQAFAGPVTVPVSGNTITVPAQTACNAPQAANYVLTGCTVMGNYYAGTTLNGSNAVSSTINVLTPGTYTITSNTNNGYSFSGSGTFNSVGPATITLFGNGTPVNAGTNTFQLSGGSGQTCAVNVFVGQPNQNAGINLGTGNCAGAVVSGNYVVNYPTQVTDYVTVNLTVTSPGYYNIYTNSANGISFQDSGYIQAAGTYPVQLFATGTPIAAGSNTYTLQSNGASGCSFAVNSTTTGSAVYTFPGAPGNCANAIVNGNYTAGVPLNPNNNIVIQVDVTSVGSLSIMTNNTNGVYFLGSLVTNVTGIHNVTLNGTGTPQSAGTNTYAANGGSSQGCNIVVTTN